MDGMEELKKEKKIGKKCIREPRLMRQLHWHVRESILSSSRRRTRDL